MRSLKIILLACASLGSLLGLSSASATVYCPSVEQIRNISNWDGNYIFGWESFGSREIAMKDTHRFINAVYY